MSPGAQLSLLGQWTRIRLLLFLRTPRAAFFTFLFPLLLLRACSTRSTAARR